MKFSRLLSLSLCFSLLAGCAGGAAQVQGSPRPLPTPQGSLPPVEELVCTSEGTLDGYSAFSVELLRQARAQGKNTLVSPLSVTLALAMTASGAAGDTLVSLTCPKFKAEWGGSLNDALQAMGLSRAFVPGQADFSAMGSVPGKDLFIGNVIHKTAFELNEKGTEAAAVTAVIMEATSAMVDPLQPIVLRLDRPFVYGIVDLQMGTALFLGTAESL